MIDLLATTWPWILLLVVFVVMHRNGHGCGMHGSHGDHGHAAHRTDHTDHSAPGERADSDRSRT